MLRCPVLCCAVLQRYNPELKKSMCEHVRLLNVGTLKLVVDQCPYDPAHGGCDVEKAKAEAGAEAGAQGPHRRALRLLGRGGGAGEWSEGGGGEGGSRGLSEGA